MSIVNNGVLDSLDETAVSDDDIQRNWGIISDNFETLRDKGYGSSDQTDLVEIAQDEVTGDITTVPNEATTVNYQMLGTERTILIDTSVDVGDVNIIYPISTSNNTAPNHVTKFIRIDTNGTVTVQRNGNTNNGAASDFTLVGDYSKAETIYLDNNDYFKE
jgi:hypothetical protein